MEGKNETEGVVVQKTLEQWLNRLKESEAMLHSVTSGTEGEFITIGERLEDFHRRSGLITQSASTAASVMSGEEIAKAIDGLNAVMQKMETQLKKIETETRCRTKKLKGILDLAERIKGPLEEYAAIAREIQDIGGDLKEGGGAHGREGCDSLAVNVKALTETMKRRLLHVQEDLKSLNNVINQTLSRVFALEARQQVEARLVLDGTAASLCSITEKYGLSTIAANGISERSNAISGRIGDIVTSMQYHDITRQQLERVKSEIGRFMERMEAAIKSEETPESIQLVYEVSSFCELLASCLRQAKEEFGHAVDNIKGNLDVIAANVSGISTETKRLAGETDTEAHTFLGAIENTLASVASTLSALDENANVYRNLSATLFYVGKTTSEHIKDIGRLSRDMGSGGNYGERGRPAPETGRRSIEEMAECFGRLSERSIELTDSVTELLREVASFLGEVMVYSKTKAPSRAFEDVQRNLDDLIESLHDLNARVQELLGKVQSEGDRLSGDIGHANVYLTVHKTVDDIIAYIVSELEGIAYGTYSIIPVYAKKNTPCMLDAAGKFNVELGPKKQPKIGDGEFGDNVALF